MKNSVGLVQIQQCQLALLLQFSTRRWRLRLAWCGDISQHLPRALRSRTSSVAYSAHAALFFDEACDKSLKAHYAALGWQWMAFPASHTTWIALQDKRLQALPGSKHSMVDIDVLAYIRALRVVYPHLPNRSVLCHYRSSGVIVAILVGAQCQRVHSLLDVSECSSLIKGEMCFWIIDGDLNKPWETEVERSCAEGSVLISKTPWQSACLLAFGLALTDTIYAT
ncbi:MAG: hypothetical protein DHS20C10_09040 [marine bacterium B5-7]|nr:MAG: hypothetical protein DHS20C10_09040 [marine bacterium B5-7]